jgi:hypothetical protein
MTKLNAKNEIPVLEIDGQILSQSVIKKKAFLNIISMN